MNFFSNTFILLAVCFYAVSGQWIQLYMSHVVKSFSKIKFTGESYSKFLKISSAPTDSENINVADGFIAEPKLHVGFQVKSASVIVNPAKQIIPITENEFCEKSRNCFKKNKDDTFKFHVKKIRFPQKTVTCRNANSTTKVFDLVVDGVTGGNIIKITKKGYINESDLSIGFEPVWCQVDEGSEILVNESSSCSAKSAFCFKNTAISNSTCDCGLVSVHLTMMNVS